MYALQGFDESRKVVFQLGTALMHYGELFALRLSACEGFLYLAQFAVQLGYAEHGGADPPAFGVLVQPRGAYAVQSIHLSLSFGENGTAGRAGYVRQAGGLFHGLHAFSAGFEYSELLGNFLLRFGSAFQLRSQPFDILPLGGQQIGRGAVFEPGGHGQLEIDEDAAVHGLAVQF